MNAVPERRPAMDVTDAALPGIDIALDVSAVAAGLGSCRHENPDFARIAGGEIEYLRYKPGTSLIAGCRFDTGTSPGPGEIRGYLKLVRPDRFDQAWSKAAAIARRSSWARVFHLKPLPLLFHLFPFDREIKGLGILADRRKMNHRLRHLVPSDSGEGRLVRELTTLRLVRYKPERRAVVSARAVFRDVQSGRESERRVHVKAYADGTGESTFRLMQSLAAVDCGDLPRFARPLRYDPVHRLLHQEELAGTPVLEADDVRTAAQRTGDRLAAFHRNAPDVPAERPPLSTREALEEARAALHVMGVLAGDDTGSQGLRLIRALQAAIPREAPYRLIHGDFHHEQVLVLEDAVAFVDFDETRPGDPRFDAGNFIAHLRAREVDGSTTAGERLAIEMAFLEGYAGAGGSVESMDWFTAAGLARLAVKPFRSWKPAWQERSCRLIRMGMDAL